MPGVYEFLYRGPIAAENRPAAWHVILAEDVTSMGKTQTVTAGPLSPEQAQKDFSIGLPDILAEINTQTMAQLTEVTSALEVASASLDAERAAHKETQDALADAQATAVEDEGPANPVLNKLTFGLAGN